MVKYGFLNYATFADFTDKLPQDRAEFSVIIEESKIVARTTLQSVVDAADTYSRAMANTILMCRKSWLHDSGFPTEVLNSVGVLPFNKTHLFNLLMSDNITAVTSTYREEQDLSSCMQKRSVYGTDASAIKSHYQQFTFQGTRM